MGNKDDYDLEELLLEDEAARKIIVNEEIAARKKTAGNTDNGRRLQSSKDSGAEADRKKTGSRGDRGKSNKKMNKALVYLSRFLITLLLTVLLLVAGLYFVMVMLVHGPSKHAAELFVVSVRETSAIGFLANWFYSEEEIQAIMERNSIKDTDDVTDPSFFDKPDEGDNKVDDNTPDIEVIDIKGATYRGKLMIIKDPSRVFVGTVPQFGEISGNTVSEMAQRYGAVAGINGGEFVDGTSKGTFTGMPVGLVMTDGQIRNGAEGVMYHVTGITYDNILVVGNMTAAQARQKNIRDCVSIANYIGPFLVVNGEAQEVSGMGGGINPRTAIGQRADKAILLLVIDGRQADSLGATFADLVYIMQEYGAVNASAMDGGTSTQMYYNGEVINVPYSPTGPRRCPTSFLVK